MTTARLLRRAASGRRLGSPTRPTTAPATSTPTLWLRAEDITSVSDNAAFSAWPARTGSNAVTQTLNGGTDPTFLASGVTAGRPAVRFERSKLSKMRVPWSLTNPANITIVAVIRTPNADGGSIMLFAGATSDSGASSGRIRCQVTTAGALTVTCFGEATASTTTNGLVANNAWTIVCASYSASKFAKARVGNTIAAASGSAMTNGGSSDLALGGYGTNSTSDLAELIAIPASLNDSDQALWVTYMATTYALTP